eukprot:jgi/Galph1/3005/GphlegSOOS_G1694.1
MFNSESSHDTKVVPEFQFKSLQLYERSTKPDTVLLNEICTKLNSRPEEFYEQLDWNPESPSWRCTLRWSNFGPFKAVGRTKKEAKAAAAKAVMDKIEKHFHPFIDKNRQLAKQWEKDSVCVSSVSSVVPSQYQSNQLGSGERNVVDIQPETVDALLEQEFSAFVSENPQNIFMIDLDNSTHLVNCLIDNCKKWKLESILLEGYAGRVYDNPNLPSVIQVMKTQATVKNAADFLMAYRAGIRTCEHKNISDKPNIVIISKDLGLEAITIMLRKEMFETYFCCSSDEIQQTFAQLSKKQEKPRV